MPTPCYISSEGKTQGNITAGAFTSRLVSLQETRFGAGSDPGSETAV